MASQALAADQAAGVQDTSSDIQGTWVGWLETPAQHLRLVIQLQTVSKTSDDAKASGIEGSITSLDQSPTAVPFSGCSISDDGSFDFTVTPQADAKLSYSYRGKRNGDLIEGWFENSKAKLPLTFRKADFLPDEGIERLGANSAWKGELNVATQKIAVRFRIYDHPPYADPDAPRVLFDSLTEKAYGFPVKWSLGGKGQPVMSIPSLPGNAKYIVDVESLPNRIQGRFLQSLLPMSLELTRVEELRDLPISSDPMILALQRQMAAKDSKQDSISNPTEEPKISVEDSLPNGVREESFSVERIDYRKPKVKQEGRWVQPKFRIGGTVTWPSKASSESGVPAVVMVSGSGPQDRDESIGTHKPFRVLAHWLATQGIASLRYDDRGVGDSSGDFLSSTTSDFADDATAVWEHAKSLDGIDRLRVGLIGHSEGGIIGPIVAANQPAVAFLILLAPPGLTGSEILAAQIDRIAEVQGVDGPTRQATAALQRKLQRLATELETNDEQTMIAVRQAVLEQWESLRGLSSQDSKEPEPVRRQRVTDQITSQFKGLQTPWMRYFLAYDPTASWLIMRSPTLAIWGDKDVQVLAGPNRQKLLEVAARNPKLQGELVVLPGINHLMQRAETGLPDEYDRISETIDPSVLEVIQEWLKQRNLIP